MESQRFPVFLIIALFGFIISSSQAYEFYVGGKNGWVLNPSESYSHWAERNRFQVNDTLFFKYKNGSDSVLVVSKDDYFSCNTKNPNLTLKDGDSIFKFDRSGAFYFISGNAEKCKKGQKLIIVVLALRHRNHDAAPPFHCPGAPPQNPALAPSAPPPKAEGPGSETAGEPGSPEPGLAPAPAPAPAKNSGSRGFGGSVMFSFSVGISAVVLSSLVGIF